MENANLLPVLLAFGVAVLKLVMGLLDKSGALAKLPAWARPMVSGALAAALALLEHLTIGGDITQALMVALAAFSGNELIHQTRKGIRKTRNGA